MKRKGKSPSNIMGHDLTWAEFHVLNAVQDYLRVHAGDSGWSPHTSPRGDGRQVPLSEIFGGRNNQDTARRQTVRRLHELGILCVCDIEFRDGMLRGAPYIRLAGFPRRQCTYVTEMQRETELEAVRAVCADLAAHQREKHEL